MFMLRGLSDWSTMEADSPPAGEDRTAAATYCGTKYGVTSPNFQPCVDFYSGPHIGEYIPGAPTVTPKAPPAGKTAIVNKLFGQQAVVAQASAGPGTIITTLYPVNTPWYKTPLGIGAILLVGFLGYRRLTR